jgi:hypothetical protein
MHLRVVQDDIEKRRDVAWRASVNFAEGAPFGQRRMVKTSMRSPDIDPMRWVDHYPAPGLDPSSGSGNLARVDVGLLLSTRDRGSPMEAHLSSSSSDCPWIDCRRDVHSCTIERTSPTP